MKAKILKMLLIFVILLGLIAVHGKNIPSYDGIQQQSDDLLAHNDIENFNARNMITVPANCPSGQELVNGVCRDIWRVDPAGSVNFNIRNMITVPANCPSGQELTNGVCREVWRMDTVTERLHVPQNVITVPTNCPDGQELINGVCRDIWRQFAVTEPNNINNKNAITVPTNCRPGQQLINGTCRDIWRGSPLEAEYFEEFLKALALHTRNSRQAEDVVKMNVNIEDLLQMSVDKNIINIPNQCPNGYRPDANGICREVLP